MTEFIAIMLAAAQIVTFRAGICRPGPCDHFVSRGWEDEFWLPASILQRSNSDVATRVTPHSRWETDLDTKDLPSLKQQSRASSQYLLSVGYVMADRISFVACLR
jgi:hypothetical protein